MMLYIFMFTDKSIFVMEFSHQCIAGVVLGEIEESNIALSERNLSFCLYCKVKDWGSER